MDPAFLAHWPLPSGWDFAKASHDEVAYAVAAQVRWFVPHEPLHQRAIQFDRVDDVFAAPPVFDNVSLHFFIVATRSPWVAIWTSTFLCSGYDSLSHGLTRKQGIETVHFRSSDTPGPFQPGTVFTHRTTQGERSIAAIKEDNRWQFHVSGTPLAEEDPNQYSKLKVSERWNSAALLALLQRLGIRPWSEDFYDFSIPVLHIWRPNPPPTVARMSREEFSARYRSQ